MHELFELTFKILLTIVLSSVVGLERGLRHKDAGLRTHILVGVGSALIVLTSLFLFEKYQDVTIIDPTRMITGIVTGIGFLCAGTIIRSGSQVKGLTTAATLWVVSGVGISVGAGNYSAAILVSFIVVIVLIGVRAFEKKLGQKLKNVL